MTFGTWHMGKDTEVLIMARRFTIITLFAAIFAVSFSAAVNRLSLIHISEPTRPY